LAERGARTTCVSSAAKALEVLAAQRFDILLSDIGMPDVDGFELIQRVRLMDASRSGPIPAIAITAYARPEDRQRSLLAGFNMHLSKPIEAGELIASIAGLLRLSR
jgi:CheY-like chemotaxis protein